MKRFIFTFTSLLFFLFILLFPTIIFAQGESKFIYISGFVVDGNSSEPVPGVHLYIPKAGRGTATSPEGFFAMAVFPGDSVIISSIGFKKQFYRVPKDKGEGYSVVIELVEDITELAIIEVFPYPTEELFKEAFVALKLPDEERMEILRQNLSQQLMARMATDLPMDGKMNYRYQMYRDATNLGNQNFVPTLQLLNPFAWAQFIQSIKRGDFKKDKWKK